MIIEDLVEEITYDELLQVGLFIEKEIERRRLKLIAEYNVPLSVNEGAFLLEALAFYTKLRSLSPEDEKLVANLISKIDYYLMPQMGG